MRRWAAGLLGAVIVMVSLGAPVSAQDDPEPQGLSAEQVALVDRMAHARALLDKYGSYAAERSEVERQSVVVSMLGFAQELTAIKKVTRSDAVVRQGGAETVQSTMRVTVSETGGGAANARDYGIDAEVRLIDDVFYVNARYVTPRPDLPGLPRGWTVVEGDDVLYGVLELDRLAESSSLWDDAGLVKGAASDVTLDTESAPDGTALDVITITFDYDGVVRVLPDLVKAGYDSDLAAVWYDALGDGSRIELVIKLAADDTPFYAASDARLEALGLNANEIAPGQFSDGMTLDYVLDMTATAAYSQHNAPLLPAAVPDLGR